jgi:hypothetical protein
MKRILFTLFATVSLIGCAVDEPPPSQFEATEQKFEILGCQDLKQTIDEHNRLNPGQHMVADC